MATVNPYLNFRNNAREAMEFYRSVFGGELTVNTFADFQADDVDPSERDLVMHSQLTAPDFTLMGADTPTGMPYQEGSRISVSVSGDDETELRSCWDKLSNGATIAVPLEPAPWGDSFGMLTDRYGIEWMVNISAPQG